MTRDGLKWKNTWDFKKNKFPISMKKLLGILVLGLLLCSTSFAESSLPSCEGAHSKK